MTEYSFTFRRIFCAAFTLAFGWYLGVFVFRLTLSVVFALFGSGGGGLPA